MLTHNKKSKQEVTVKKVLVLFLLVIITGGRLFSESMRDTEDYRKMMEIKAKYDEAYEAGDYDTAMEYAREIRRYVDALNQLADERLGRESYTLG